MLELEEPQISKRDFLTTGTLFFIFFTTLCIYGRTPFKLSFLNWSREYLGWPSTVYHMVNISLIVLAGLVSLVCLIGMFTPKRVNNILHLVFQRVSWQKALVVFEILYFAAFTLNYFMSWIQSMVALANVEWMFFVIYGFGFIWWIGILTIIFKKKEKQKETHQRTNIRKKLITVLKEMLSRFKWWYFLHSVLCKIIAGIFIVCSVIVIILLSWEIIEINAAALSFMASLFTGIALAIFAYRTFRLSSSLAEQEIPWIQISSLSNPIEGIVESGLTKYTGLIWELSILNIGAIPAWVEQLMLDLSNVKTGVWYSINVHAMFIGCASQTKAEIDTRKPIIIDPHEDLTITIIVHDSKLIEELNLMFGGREGEFMLKLMAHQKRQLGGRDKSGWIDIYSQRFSLPDNFKSENKYVGEGLYYERPKGFHQP